MCDFCICDANINMEKPNHDIKCNRYQAWGNYKQIYITRNNMPDEMHTFTWKMC